MNGVQYSENMMAARNPRHDRESVTDVALSLLDQVGLPDLSMRRLAAELDVQPSALYWHFASKQELLAAVADRIVGQIPQRSADSSDAATRLLLTARSIRDALLAYRDGAEVVQSTAALRLGATRATEIIHHAILDAPLAPDVRSDVADAVLQFILGHTMLLQQRMHAASHGADAGDESPFADSSSRVFDTGIALFSAGIPLSGALRSAQSPA